MIIKFTCKKGIYLKSYTIISSKLTQKWITDWNVRVKTIKLLDENIWENHCAPGLGKGFLAMTQKNNP